MAQGKYSESSADLAADIVESAQQLVHLEVALAKQEVKELAVSNGVAAGSFALAGLLAMIALLVALPMVLVLWMDNHVLGAVIWFAVYVLVAAGAALFGKSRLRIEAPRRTISSLKETRSWLLHQLNTKSR